LVNSAKSEATLWRWPGVVGLNFFKLMVTH